MKMKPTLPGLSFGKRASALPPLGEKTMSIFTVGGSKRVSPAASKRDIPVAEGAPEDQEEAKEITVDLQVDEFSATGSDNEKKHEE